MNDIFVRILARLQSERGQSLAEFGLILGLIAVVCLVALGALGAITVAKLDTFNAAFGS